MTRTVVTIATILLLTVSVGCQNSNQGLGQRLPQRSGTYGTPPDPAAVGVETSSDELDLVEQMSSHRQAYRASLEVLIQHYSAVGNNQKLTWAREELESLDRIPQYRYIVDAQVMGPELKASARIQAADQLYAEATEIERRAAPFPVLKDEDGLRAALDKYSQLIRQYPTSDKIDDVAYRMAGIHDYFKEYTIALEYYKRTYQWDPLTPYPARFKAAYILDKKLHRRAEALTLYQESVVKEAQHDELKMYAEKRIESLSRSDTEVE